MTPEEKKELVDALNDRGVFLLKGVVSEVADRLEVSEQTIYRYLK
jgi:predicted transcriptional regulator YheO